MKYFIISIFLFITSEALSQRFNVRYRTALDSTNIPHSIVFLNNKTVKINLWRGPGVYFTDSKDLPNEFNYLKNNDTITIEYADKEALQPTNSIAYRIIKSKFIVKTKDELYDVESGYTYISEKLIRKLNLKNGILVVFEGKSHIIRNRNGYFLRRKLKRIGADSLEAKIIKGKDAFDKYGIEGLNGVVEIKRK